MGKQYRWSVAPLSDKVRQWEALMKEAMQVGGLSYDEAVWYVSTISKEGK